MLNVQPRTPDAAPVAAVGSVSTWPQPDQSFSYVILVRPSPFLRMSFCLVELVRPSSVIVTYGVSG